MNAAARATPARWSMLGSLGLLLAGCAANTPRETWTDPAWHGPALQKIVVASIQPSDGRRRLWEDGMALAFKAGGIDAIPSYQLVPQSEPTPALLSEAAARAGYDGLVVARLVSTGTSMRQSPGSTQMVPESAVDSKGNVYTYMHPVYEPGSVDSEQVADYQTDVYATGSGGRLVWTAASRVGNQGSVKALAQQVSSSVIPALEASGTLAARQ